MHKPYVDKLKEVPGEKKKQIRYQNRNLGNKTLHKKVSNQWHHLIIKSNINTTCQPFDIFVENWWIEDSSQAARQHFGRPASGDMKQFSNDEVFRVSLSKGCTPSRGREGGRETSAPRWATAARRLEIETGEDMAVGTYRQTSKKN